MPETPTPPEGPQPEEQQREARPSTDYNMIRTRYWTMCRSPSGITSPSEMISKSHQTSRQRRRPGPLRSWECRRSLPHWMRTQRST
eukprot:8541779-Pyramimonas_sp.AAC.1